MVDRHPSAPELAADLLTSLDGEPEANVEAAWATEIERCAREALANPHDDVAWEPYAPSCMQLRRNEEAGPACL